jgi:hypothetical protein
MDNELQIKVNPLPTREGSSVEEKYFGGSHKDRRYPELILIEPIS